jgi:uncharacterized protein (TIGR03000 family)
MYSVVLLMALSANADAPAGFFGGGCDGCNGCCGGYSCSGCCGGGLFSGLNLFGGKGCCSGCCGGHSSCHGCSGCCGYSSCHGCCGGGGLFSRLHDRWGHGCCGGCHGCCGGCHGCDGGCHGCVGGHASVIESGPATMPKAEAAAPATIIVNLPADAKLTIDGNATTSTTDRRVFVSPALEPNQEYYYTVQAELNGQSKSERVTVRAGQEVNVKIEIPNSVATK